MGRDKPFIRLGGTTLIERAAGCLAEIFTEVFIVANGSSGLEAWCDKLPYHFLSDRESGLGPIGGLEAVLGHVQNKPVFVVGADMPFLNSSVIKEMIPFSDRYALVIPFLSGKLHPLHALYTQKCFPVIKSCMRRKQLTLRFLVEEVNSYLFPETEFRKFDPHLYSVVNINTPQDLAKARLTLRKGQP